jgi:hypothetical protein
MRAFLVVRSSLTVGRDSERPYIWGDTHYQGIEVEDNGPVRVPEAVHFDRAATERECERRELAARELLNPFWLGPTVELSSRNADDIHADIGRMGLTPPPAPNPFDVGSWYEWWDHESANWTAEQRAAVWAMFDKVRLFEVVEIELE